MRRITFCIAALSSLSTVYAEEEDACIPKYHKKPYRFTIRHIESGGIGYSDGYTTFQAFIASDPSLWTVTPFLDARGHVFDNGKWAANLGAGLRTQWKSRIYGINGYYDYRDTGRFNSNQVGFGFETLGQIVDFRINGYLPVSTKLSDPYNTTFANFFGNGIILSQSFQSAMKGVNMEAGLHIGNFQSLDLYAAAGPYYFTGEGTPSTWGAKGRIGATCKEILSVEISDSYDKTFHNRFQGEVGVIFSFASAESTDKVKKTKQICKIRRSLKNQLYDRKLQPVDRQEIVVIDTISKNTTAIDPATGLPYKFVFVNNTSQSNGTYESPYHNFTQVEDYSSPGDIIYVYPGDGTTKGMDAGITLKDNQKFWGSGISYSLETAQGTIFIPAQSNTAPTITNTDINTEGNAITLSTNNAVSDFVITGAMNDGIYGIDPQSLQISSCTFENNTTFAVEASFAEDANISLTNNRFVDNVNGVYFTLNGSSTFLCEGNSFTGQTSVSSVPIDIAAINNTIDAQINNNIFDNNNTGTIRFNLDNVIDADIRVFKNVITNNGTGSQASLGSSFVILSSGIIDSCAIELTNNRFSGNNSNALYLHTSGAFTTLRSTVSGNTMSHNGGSALVFATPVDIFTLVATHNTIFQNNDNGIAIISSGSSSTGTITINNNTITDIGNASSGIAINQDFSNLNLTVIDNQIHRCEGTGLISYAPTGINDLTLDNSGNAISDCQNLSSNAASGLDMEQYTNLVGSIQDNTFTNNTGTAVVIGSTLPSPAACLNFSGNNSDTDYLLTNPSDGVFNLSPCDVDTTNIGVINESGTINTVHSCSDPTPCP